MESNILQHYQHTFCKGVIYFEDGYLNCKTCGCKALIIEDIEKRENTQND